MGNILCTGQIAYTYYEYYFIKLLLTYAKEIQSLYINSKNSLFVYCIFQNIYLLCLFWILVSIPSRYAFQKPEILGKKSYFEYIPKREGEIMGIQNLSLTFQFGP